MLRRLSALGAVAALLLVTGCSGGGNESGDPVAKLTTVDESEFVDYRGERVVDIDVADNRYDAQFVLVSPGTKVRWTNVGANPHNVQPQKDSEFTGVVTTAFGANQKYAVTFRSVGDYPYFCSVHGTNSLKGQWGLIRVANGTRDS